VGESPTAAYSAVDPSLGAVFRRSGMAICQAVKDIVLSRGRSHVPKDMARGGIGIAQWGEAALKPVLSSSPGSSGDFALGQSIRGQGTEARQGLRVEPHPSLPVSVGLAKRRCP
jgi:hypothetical protein